MLKAGEVATVTTIYSQTDIQLTRYADGAELGDGFKAADLAQVTLSEASLPVMADIAP